MRGREAGEEGEGSGGKEGGKRGLGTSLSTPTVLFSDNNQFTSQYLNVLMIFCMKLLHQNENKKHFLSSLMMVYTFISILFTYSRFQYTFRGWVSGDTASSCPK